MKMKPVLPKSALYYALAFPLVLLYCFGNRTAVPAPLFGTSYTTMATDTCAPIVNCVTAIAVELLPADLDNDGHPGEGAIEVHAHELVVSSGSTCSDSLRLSIHEVDEILSGADVPAPGQESIFFTCDNLGTVYVRVYVWDNNFNPDAVQPDGTVGGPNYSYCETYILVQDNMFDLCNPNPPGVSGFIWTAVNEGVDNVQVAFHHNNLTQYMLASSGSYFFNFTGNPPYTITPSKDTFDINGVTVFDKVLIGRHILGIQKLGDPYKMIAADVNNDQKITTIDLIHLHQLIIGESQSFPSNTSWRFVQATYSFPDATNPWIEPFPESKTVTHAGQGDEHDFIGIKIGDVNNSAN